MFTMPLRIPDGMSALISPPSKSMTWSYSSCSDSYPWNVELPSATTAPLAVVVMTSIAASA